jgi:hypothetical protein
MTTRQKQLFLHIGTRKTGSSLIQNFCQANKAKLLEQGFFYPDNDTTLERKGKSAGHWSLHKLIEDKESRYPLERYLPDPCPAGNIILSNEAIASEHCDILKVASKAHQMLAEDFQVTIIIYVRRQDFFINSLYNEGIVSGNRKAEWSLREFLDGGHTPELDYHELLQSWAKVFGTEHIRVRPFEKQQFYDGDLIKDFLHCIGLEWQEDFIIPGEESKNPSPDIVFVEAVRQLNRIPLQLRPMYRDFLENAFDEFVFNGRYFAKKGQSSISPTERIKILDRYAQSNEKVAQEFLGRTDGKLFYEPEPRADEPWQEVTVNEPDLVLRLLSLFLEQKASEIDGEFSRCNDRLKEHQDQIAAARQAQEKNREALDQTREELAQTREKLSQTRDELSQTRNDLEMLRKQKRDKIERRKKENLALQNLLYRQVLATFHRSRKNPLKRLYRFLRRPGLNEAKLLHKSGLVDPYYYFANCRPAIGTGITAAEHYVRYGAPQGKNPSENFDTRKYLAEHPHVAHNGLNPLVHYILNRKETTK